MFERFTETARQAIFFARYEASQFGSEHIETEQLLLGLFRADGALALRLFSTTAKIHSIREQIEKQSARREKISVSVDLPLSQECRRVLTYAAEEAVRLSHKHIATEHLFMGLLREEKCAAARILLENGVTSAQVAPDAAPVIEAKPTTSQTESACDLTAAAGNGELSPLIGRERELERIIQILARRTRNNPVLIGEPGVGKNALVDGLAQRIADGATPGILDERPILKIDASLLLSSVANVTLSEIANRTNAILYIPGLFDLAASGWAVSKAIQLLEPLLARGELHCIATGTPSGYRLTMGKAKALAGHFGVVAVLPPSEEETIRIVSAVKEQYEKFHGVVITGEAIETAVSLSRWFLRSDSLPERAIDLIDDAGARTKLRLSAESPEMIEIQRRIRVITRRMENAIASHDFARARVDNDEERKERQNLQRLREELKQSPRNNIVTPEDIVEAIAARTGTSVAIVKGVLQAKPVEPLELIAKALAARIPGGRQPWTENLAAWLVGCSAEEAESLAQAIRAAKTRLDLPSAG